MTEYPDTLWCNNCHERQSFTMAGSGTKGICLNCGKEQDYSIEARVKALMDFMFTSLSNMVDK